MLFEKHALREACSRPYRVPELSPCLESPTTAVSNGQVAIARFLLEHGADVNMYNRTRPLHLAIPLHMPISLEMTQLMLEYRAKIAVKDRRSCALAAVERR
jgi:ankyrin repeat protein